MDKIEKQVCAKTPHPNSAGVELLDPSATEKEAAKEVKQESDSEEKGA
jgi:hypothetical protein